MPRRNAVLLFSKIPQPGKVKTRLTPLKDGVLPPEVASRLYHCMFFDVVEICCDALAELERRRSGLDEDAYDIIISSPGVTSSEMMRELFERSGTWPREIIFIHDEGGSFDEHYNDAFEQVWEMGYDTILSMGCDMPALPRAVIVEGFERLHAVSPNGGGVVLSPDQEMGVSLVGWTRDTPFDHDGVFYNRDGLTVLPAYIRKAQSLGIPAFYLPAVPDVDTMADLNHNVTLVQAIEFCARFQNDLSTPWRTADAFRTMGYSDIRVMPNALHDSREEVDGRDPD